MKNAKFSEKQTSEKTARLQSVHIILIYSILYAVLAGLLVFLFYEKGRSLVYHSDAWRQHLRALAYYGKWLRGNLYNLFINHDLHLQSWTFGLGYGGDVLTTLHYYCIGEPLTALSVFVPEQYTKIFFEILILLRPYLAGLSFIAYAGYVIGLWKKHCTFHGSQLSWKTSGILLSEASSVIAGALCYSFCGTTLYLGLLHPFFVTPMIWLPLMLLGIEKVLQERRPILFISVTCLAALSNFYFFYMLAVMCGGYGIVRSVSVCRRSVSRAVDCGSGEKENSRPYWEKILLILARLLLYAAVGTAAAGCILIPVIVQYLQNPRSETRFAAGLFYGKNYYLQLPRNLISFINHPLYDTELCTSLVAVAAVILLFLLKGHRELKFAVIIAGMMLVFPFAGRAMNGFSYVINRWTFAVEFLNALILTIVLSDLADGRVEWLFHSRHSSGKRQYSREKKCQAAIVTVSFLSIMSVTLNILQTGISSFPDEFVRIQAPEEYLAAAYSNEAAAITTYEAENDSADGDLSNHSFWRYSGQDLTWNASLPLGTSSTQFCWSLANGNISDFFQKIGNRDEQDFAYYALDDRTILQAFTGVNYYVLSAYDNYAASGNTFYGYTDGGTVRISIPSERDSWESGVNEYQVYKNYFALPIAFTFDQTISEDDFDALTMTERQEALLQAAVIGNRKEKQAEKESLDRSEEDDQTGYLVITDNGSSLAFSEKDVPYTLTNDAGVSIIRDDDGITFDVEKDGAAITLSFAGLSESETYVVLEKLEGEPRNSDGTLQESCQIEFTGVSVYNQSSDKVLRYLTPKSQYYSNWHDFAVNLGYSAVDKTKAVLTFRSAGVYHVKSLKVICQPMEQVMSFIPYRLQGAMSDPDLHRNPVSYATSQITGSVNIPASRSGSSDDSVFLMFNIPYSTGWTCYIDGQAVPLRKADIMFMGTSIKSGDHVIELRYHTPGGTAGLLMSFFGIIGMIILCAVQNKSQHRMMRPERKETF